MKSESIIQREIVKWSRHQAAIGKIPELELLYSNLTGAHLKKGGFGWGQLVAEGAMSGIPDLHLAVPNGPYASMYIEVKTEVGQLSPKQKKVKFLLEKYNNYVVVVRSLDEFRKELSDYLGGGLEIL